MANKSASLKKIPKGFKLMKLTLNLMNRQVKPFEEYVLRHVICSFYIFYTKKPIHSGMTEIWLYCRPQDEVTLAYHIGIAAGSAMFHRPKKYWENQIHDVVKPFPESYHIDIKLPDFHSEFVETSENSNNVSMPFPKGDLKIHESSIHKFEWGVDDNLLTIHQKLKALEGHKLRSTQNEKNHFILFEVGEIKETQLECLGKGFGKFLEGDSKYATKEGGYNFKDAQVIPMWGFTVLYGNKDKKGYKYSMSYNFMIPRSGTFPEDVLKNPILYDENHPFVFYNLKD